MKEETTFETYGKAQFWIEGWYTIEELEQVVKDLKLVKERQDKALLNSMKQIGVIK